MIKSAKHPFGHAVEKFLKFYFLFLFLKNHHNGVEHLKSQHQHVLLSIIKNTYSLAVVKTLEDVYVLWSFGSSAILPKF